MNCLHQLNMHQDNRAKNPLKQLLLGFRITIKVMVKIRLYFLSTIPAEVEGKWSRIVLSAKGKRGGEKTCLG